METILKTVVLVIVLVTVIIFYTLHRNGAHISQPPGVAKRLAVFFTVNSASTSDKPSFDELRTPVFAVGAEELYQQVLYNGSDLGWGILANDKDEHNVNFVVRSPVFLFEDDVYVEVEAVNENHSSLHIRSSSRTGNADLAANSGHIQKLVKKMKAKEKQ
jgi:hypothetical protein